MLYDCHVHSEFSKDGQSTMEELCERAVALRMAGICFTDHIDSSKSELMNEASNIERYFNNIEFLQKKYKGLLQVISAYEFSEPHKNLKLLSQIESYPFAYRMVSIHRGNISVPLNSDNGYHEFTKSYLQEAVRAVECASFDTLGHIDLIRRLSSDFPFYQSDLEKLYTTMIAKDMALEINTHSFSKNHQFSYDDFSYVRIWKECNGKRLVLGSDAHKVNRLMENFERIISLLPDGLKVGHWIKRKFYVDYVL